MISLMLMIALLGVIVWPSPRHSLNQILPRSDPICGAHRRVVLLIYPKTPTTSWGDKVLFHIILDLGSIPDQKVSTSVYLFIALVPSDTERIKCTGGNRHGFVCLNHPRGRVRVFAAASVACHNLKCPLFFHFQGPSKTGKGIWRKIEIQQGNVLRPPFGLGSQRPVVLRDGSHCHLNLLAVGSSVGPRVPDYPYRLLGNRALRGRVSTRK